MHFIKISNDEPLTIQDDIEQSSICFMNESCVVNWCSLNGACGLNMPDY